MIPTSSAKPVQTIGNTDKRAASIQLTPQLVALLSADMYEDQLLAMIRELLSNGRDAQKEAGTTDIPMQLQLPNTFEPFLCFRDFGTGLTYQQMFDIYLTYGASTKRDSNDYIGMFGIGSKSPLSYTDNFLVSSFINGEESQYNIYMDSGIPSIALMFTRPTTEKDGLKISIAINQKDFVAIKNRAQHFLKLFNFPVEVTGQSDFNFECPKLFEDENYMLVSNYRNGAFALMGGVTYELSSQVFESLRETINADTIILSFELGELNVAGSRERLSFVEGDSTDTKIKSRVEVIKSSYFENMNDTLSKCKTMRSVVRMAKDTYNLGTVWGGYFKLEDKLLFKGVSLKDWRGLLNDGIEWRVFTGFGDKVRDSIEKGTSSFGLTTYERSSIRDDMVRFFDGDRDKSNVKAARKYARTSGKKVIFDATQEEKEWLQMFVGDIETVKCSDVYDELYPKIVRDKSAVKVRKVSGVFQYKHCWFKEVTEMSDNATGYYVDMTRNTVHIDGKDIKHSELFTLVDNGVIDSLYFIRKTAANKNRPDTLTKLDGKVVPMLEGMFNKRMVKKYIQKEIMPSVNRVYIHDEFIELHDVLKDKYPTLNWYTNVQKTTYKYDLLAISNLCRKYGVELNLQLKIDKAKDRVLKSIRTEDARFKEGYPLYDLFIRYGYVMSDSQKVAIKKAIATEIKDNS